MEYVIKEKIFRSVNISSIIISFIISITLLVVIFRSIKIISVNIFFTTKSKDISVAKHFHNTYSFIPASSITIQTIIHLAILNGMEIYETLAESPSKVHEGREKREEERCYSLGNS